MDWQTLLIIALLTTGIFAYSIGTLLVRRAVSQSLLEPIEERFGFRRVDNDDVEQRRTVLDGDWDGTQTRIIHESRPWYQADNLTFRLYHELPLGGEVRFSRRTALHRLARRIGLVPDIDPVDRDFHRRIAPEAEHDEDIGALVDEAGVREALLRLIRDRRTEVSIDPEGVAVRYRGRLFLPGAGLRPHARPAAAQASLIELHQLLDAATLGLRGHRRAEAGTTTGTVIEDIDDPWMPLAEAITAHRWGHVLLIGPMLLFAGPALLFWGIDYPPLDWRLYGLGAAGGLVLLTAYGALAYRILRGRSRSLRDFSLFFTTAAIGLLTLVPGAAAGINGAFDPGPPEASSAVVERHLGDGRHLHIRVTDPASRTLVVAVRQATYRDLQRGDEVAVWVMPGALDFPWLLGVRDAPER